MQKKTINIVTLGCSKNLVDSENLITQIGNQYKITHNSNHKSDIVIINTCGFIKDAKEESIDTILNFIEQKKAGNIDYVYVIGCLSQRYKSDLEKEIPEIDQYFGVNDIKKILKRINLSYRNNLYGERKITTPNHYAYIKIAEGCNRKCSFCAIPNIRGKYKSYDQEQIIEEVKYLAKNSVKEFNLIAQDISYYGYDLNKKNKLTELVNKLSDIKGVEWLRLHYSYPLNFPIELIELMAKKENICNYLDIPIQHISDKVLKKMRRGHLKKDTIKLIQNIRSINPNIALRTTLLVGHPGEEEKDFKELIDFVKETKFDRLGVFTYSEEENTFAAINYKDTIPELIKEERAAQIMEIQQNISLELNQTKIGKNFKVLIDKFDGEFYIGRTEYDSPEVDNEVLIKSEKTIELGTFHNIKITDATEFDLYGEF